MLCCLKYFISFFWIAWTYLVNWSVTGNQPTDEVSFKFIPTLLNYCVCVSLFAATYLICKNFIQHRWLMIWLRLEIVSGFCKRQFKKWEEDRFVFSLCFTMIKVQWCDIDFWCWVITILGDGYIERDSRKAWYCQGNWKETSWTPSSIWFLNFQTSQLHFIKHILMFILWLKPCCSGFHGHGSPCWGSRRDVG